MEPNHENLYLPQSPVFVCQDPLDLSIRVLGVDIIEPRHQVAILNPLTQHSKEDIVRKLDHRGHTSYGQYVAGPRT